MGRQTLTYDERTSYPLQTRELPSPSNPFRKRILKGKRQEDGHITPTLEIACFDCRGCDVRLTCPAFRGKRHGRVKR